MQKNILNFLIEIVKESNSLMSGSFLANTEGGGADLITNLYVEVEGFLINKIR